MSLRLGGLLLTTMLAWSGPLAAHSRGTSYSDWQLQSDSATVRVRVSQLELTRLQLQAGQTPEYAARVGELLAENIQLWSHDGQCVAAAASADAVDDGWVSASWSLHCPAPDGLVIRSTLFQDVAPGHLHFARVQRGTQSPQERVLSYAEPAFTLDDPADAPASFVRYVRLGIAHILSGWDHLCFVLALILLASSLREVALIATGFTLAHSLTLAAAVLGWATVDSGAIEALIGFSIALVAAENLWLRAGRERWVPRLFVAVLVGLALSGLTSLPWLVLAGLAMFTACYFALTQRTTRPLRLRAALALIFGLVHGFGFAGAMTPLNLPAERLAAGLLGFNIGVELGQLLVIALVWPLLKLLGRLPALRARAGDSVSAIICGMGTFWFLTRAFG